MTEQTPAPTPRPRPLSPHLQVYRLPMAALMSISHRISGIGLSAGFMVLAVWLWAAATHAECFNTMQGLLASKLGVLAIAAWVAAFFYHLASGVRHMIWDAGVGFAKDTYGFTNYVVVAAAAALTLCTFVKLWPFFSRAYGI